MTGPVPRIDLIRVGVERDRRDQPTGWSHGSERMAPATAGAVAAAVQSIGREAGTGDGSPDAVLLLDADFDAPDIELLSELLAGPADVWHAGVALGLGDQPRLWDRVDPVSMFSAAIEPDIETTSWRLSLRAALVRLEVLRQLGGPDCGFDTLAGSGLEVGLRWMRSGALVRHRPALAPEGASKGPLPTAADGLRIMARHRGRVWASWAFQQGLGREVRRADLWACVRALCTTDQPPLVHFQAPVERRRGGSTDRTVSVIVPTVDRYPYLEPLLHQLADQTVAAHQVIVVDQTPLDHRRRDLHEIEPDLPVTVAEIPVPGQCSARNAALGVATGELIALLDDDIDIAPTLIESYLDRLVEGVDAVSGAVDDATAGPPPEGFRHRRASDVFPGGNTVVRRSALESSGLFDPAFDHGARADHDLGMRLHLAGALLVYDPTIEVYHHHAPVGGLRTHGARKVTRAGSRRSLTQRNLPSVTEMYLARRYFTAEQRAEQRRIALLSQLSGDGPPLRRLGRAVVQLASLPDSVRRLRDSDRAAAVVYADRLPIPTLEELGADG